MTDRGRRFRVGDRVRHKRSGLVGTVTPYSNLNGCWVCYPGDDEDSHVLWDEIEFADPKMAFLRSLKELLEEFDAKIYPNGCVVDGIGFKVGDEDIYYDMNYGFGDYITASNIMDFEK